MPALVSGIHVHVLFHSAGQIYMSECIKVDSLTSQVTSFDSLDLCHDLSLHIGPLGKTCLPYFYCRYLKGQYHAIFSNTLKIERRYSVDSSQDIMTKIP